MPATICYTLPPETLPLDPIRMRPFLSPPSGGTAAKMEAAEFIRHIQERRWADVWMLSQLGSLTTGSLCADPAVVTAVLEAHRAAGLAWSAVLEHWPLRPITVRLAGQIESRSAAPAIRAWLQEHIPAALPPHGSTLDGLAPWRDSAHPLVREEIAPHLSPEWIADPVWSRWLRGAPAYDPATPTYLAAIQRHPAATPEERARLWELTRPPERQHRPWDLQAWERWTDPRVPAPFPDLGLRETLQHLAGRGIPPALAESFHQLITTPPPGKNADTIRQEQHQRLLRDSLLRCPHQTVEQLLAVLGSIAAPPARRQALQIALQHPSVTPDHWSSLVALLPEPLQRQEILAMARERSSGPTYVTNLLHAIERLGLHPPDGSRHAILTALVGHPATTVAHLTPFLDRIPQWPDVVGEMARRPRWRLAPELASWWAALMDPTREDTPLEVRLRWTLDPTAPLAWRQDGLLRLARQAPSRIRQWVLSHGPTGALAPVLTQATMAVLLTKDLPTESRRRLDLVTQLHAHWGARLEASQVSHAPRAGAPLPEAPASAATVSRRAASPPRSR